MTRTPEEFKELFLDMIGKETHETPNLWGEYMRHHLAREGAKHFALEHTVFAANFPSWLANICGRTPHLDVRRYLIENMFVEEVKDPTIPVGHYESMVDFTEALGVDRDYIYDSKGTTITKMMIAYCEGVSRTKPWLEAFAAIAGNEVSRGTEMIKRYGEGVKSTRERWAPLNLPPEALLHWDAAVAADSSEGGHGDMPLEILMKYADTNEKQEACIGALRERKQVSRVHSDSVGRDAFAASGLTPPAL